MVQVNEKSEFYLIWKIHNGSLKLPKKLDLLNFLSNFEQFFKEIFKTFQFPLLEQLRKVSAKSESVTWAT